MTNTCQIVAVQPTCFRFRLYFAFIFELEINDGGFFSGASMSCDPVIGKKPYCVITQERCETPLLIG